MGPVGVEVRRALVEAMRLLYGRGLVNLLGGNASAKLVLPDGTSFIYITPSGAVKPLLSPEDIAVMAPDGTVYEGRPSSEYRLHLAIYSRRGDVRAVVHAHAVLPVVMDRLGVGVRRELLGVEADYYLGRCVARVPSLPPGSQELADAAARALSECDVAILESHGVVAVGTSEDPVKAVFEAVDRIEVLSQLSLASILYELFTRLGGGCGKS